MAKPQRSSCVPPDSYCRHYLCRLTGDLSLTSEPLRPGIWLCGASVAIHEAMPNETKPADAEVRQSDAETLKLLEGKDKDEEYEQAKIGLRKGDAKTFNQLSSSGEAAKSKRGK